MAFGAEQLGVVAIRLVVTGVAALTLLTRVAGIALAFAVALAGAVALALAIAQTRGAGLAVWPVVSGRTAHPQLLHTEPLLQIGGRVLVVNEPLLQPMLVVIGQRVALIAASVHLPA